MTSKEFALKHAGKIAYIAASKKILPISVQQWLLSNSGLRAACTVLGYSFDDPNSDFVCVTFGSSEEWLLDQSPHTLITPAGCVGYTGWWVSLNDLFVHQRIGGPAKLNKDENPYPKTCPRCKSPAFISLNFVDCSSPSCSQKYRSKSALDLR